MKLKSCTWLKVAALSLLVVGLNSPGRADEEQSSAAGTWKWSFTTQNGQTFASTLKLKQSGDTLTGTIVRQDGTETPIEAGTVKDNEVSFKVVRERNGQKVTVTYQGKLSGNAIKGTIAFERDGQTQTREWEAKREPASAQATGTWKWTFTGQNGQEFVTTLNLKQEGEKLAGKISGRRGEPVDIEDGKVQDNQVSFTVTRERNGQKFTSKYQAKLSGDTLKGTIESERNGQTRSRDWEAKREKASVTGLWKWTFTGQNGRTFDLQARLKQDGESVTGTIIRGENETAIEDGKIVNNELSFQVTRERNGQKFVSKYQGKLAEDTLTGKISGNFGGQDRSFDWEAKRAKE